MQVRRCERGENNKMQKYMQKTRPEPHKATYLTYFEIESRDQNGNGAIAKKMKMYKKGGV